ncbi:MAG: caspase family protein [bacterium]|nr:caspase family protein [bacterium]
MRSAAAFLLAFLTICLAGSEAFAEKRVALVIGNSAYQNVPRLANTVNDARAVADMFRNAKFDVVAAWQDQGIVEMRRMLREFSDRSRGADFAVVYYAGHGIEIDGVNYLIPIDAVLERDRDAFDEAIPLERVLQTIEPASKLRLVILDACRDNPFGRDMKRTTASRAITRGLIGVEPSKPNTLIAFAAKGGSTADDGTSSHSPFTTALLNHLTTPGLDLRKALGLVRDEVMSATGGRQEPFVYGSLGGNDVALVPGTTAAASSGGSPTPSAQADTRRDYELALQLGSREGWESFLGQYPSGFYSDLARGQLRRLSAEDGRGKPAEAAKATAGPGSGGGQIAALSPPSAPVSSAPGGADLARAIQSELKRVGCFTETINGDWAASSRRSLEAFNKYSGKSLDAKYASTEALDAVRARSARVCPLQCGRGFRADGDTCVATRPKKEVERPAKPEVSSPRPTPSIAAPTPTAAASSGRCAAGYDACRDSKLRSGESNNSARDICRAMCSGR